MTHAKFHFNWLMLTLIFGIWASEPPGPGERLKRPGLIGLSIGIITSRHYLLSERDKIGETSVPGDNKNGGDEKTAEKA